METRSDRGLCAFRSQLNHTRNVAIECKVRPAVGEERLYERRHGDLGTPDALHDQNGKAWPQKKKEKKKEKERKKESEKERETSQRYWFGAVSTSVVKSDRRLVSKFL